MPAANNGVLSHKTKAKDIAAEVAWLERTREMTFRRVTPPWKDEIEDLGAIVARHNIDSCGAPTASATSRRGYRQHLRRRAEGGRRRACEIPHMNCTYIAWLYRCCIVVVLNCIVNVYRCRIVGVQGCIIVECHMRHVSSVGETCTLRYLQGDTITGIELKGFSPTHYYI